MDYTFPYGSDHEGSSPPGLNVNAPEWSSDGQATPMPSHQTPNPAFYTPQPFPPPPAEFHMISLLQDIQRQLTNNNNNHFALSQRITDLEAVLCNAQALPQSSQPPLVPSLTNQLPSSVIQTPPPLKTFKFPQVDPPSFSGTFTKHESSSRVIDNYLQDVRVRAKRLNLRFDNSPALFRKRIQSNLQRISCDAGLSGFKNSTKTLKLPSTAGISNPTLPLMTVQTNFNEEDIPTTYPAILFATPTPPQAKLKANQWTSPTSARDLAREADLAPTVDQATIPTAQPPTPTTPTTLRQTKNLDQPPPPTLEDHLNLHKNRRNTTDKTTYAISVATLDTSLQPVQNSRPKPMILRLWPLVCPTHYQLQVTA
ncbi:hypothetical protein BC829DRAFT_412759 [Chytridium lagenaria]|nr:hypothetical protein BC829DRAFT_412759 [Chytridium lagenaria]